MTSEETKDYDTELINISNICSEALCKNAIVQS